MSHRYSLTVAAAVSALLCACSPQGGTTTPQANASAATAVASAGSQAGLETLEVRIGAVGPLTGPIAHAGKDVVNSVAMALDEANAAGVVIGGKQVAFKLVSEDDAGEPKQATAVAQKLCDSKTAAVVGHLQSGTSIPASTIYHNCGIPMITASASNPDVTKAGYNNVFRVIANDNQLGEEIVNYAAKAGIKTAVIVDDRTALGQGLAKVFKETAAKNGIQILDSQFTNDKATDFMAILTAIKANQPDAIFYGGLDAQAGPMLRQMAQLGLNSIKLFAGDAVCTPKLPSLAGDAKNAESVFCATGGASIESMQGGADWFKRYNDKFPGEFQVYSPYGYDATRVLIEAMKKADSTEPSQFLPIIREMEFDGMVGNISFTEKGELKKPAITLYTYKDGARIALPTQGQ